MRHENYHKQGKLYECVYVCNAHVVTFLGAMTLLVGIRALSGILFASYHKKQ